MKYSYYPGCTLKNKAKDLDAYARVSARALGFELEEIEDWQCCGGVYPLGSDEIATKLSSVRALNQAKEKGQPEWMIMKRMDFLNRNRNDPVHRHWHILHRILSKKIQCVLKYFSFWCISFHPHPPPLPDSGMLYKPYSPVHTPEAAHCNKLILPPLLYSV